jgi:Tol biopolymer transport system component
VQWEGQAIAGARPSPDGTNVLVSGNRGGNFDLMTVSVAGGEPAILAAGPAFEGMGAWSPDGSRVAFMSTRGGTPDLWLVPSAGGEARQLTDWTPAVEVGPKWSPDGSTVAFQSNREAGVLELWTIPAAGGEATRLAPGLEVQDFNWGPDGRTIYADAIVAGGARGIYAVSIAGGAPRALLEGDVDVAWPQPSPDGTQIAHIRFGAGWGHLEVVPAAGGAVRRLTTRADQVYHTNPRWAPDGSAIAVEDFVFATSGPELEVVSWPGGEWRRLPAVPNRFILNPEWMPDSRSLTYVEFDGSRRVVVVPVPASAR